MDVSGPKRVSNLLLMQENVSMYHIMESTNWEANMIEVHKLDFFSIQLSSNWLTRFFVSLSISVFFNLF